jgi:predicted secreted protein
MGKVVGKDFAVYVDGVKIGDNTECTLNVSQALLDATSKDDANWTARLPGLREWSVDVSTLYDESNSFDVVDAIDLILNATKVQIEFSIGENGTTYFYGDAYLATGSISAPMADIATSGLTFNSDGALAKATISGS